MDYFRSTFMNLPLNSSIGTFTNFLVSFRDFTEYLFRYFGDLPVIPLKIHPGIALVVPLLIPNGISWGVFQNFF